MVRKLLLCFALLLALPLQARAILIWLKDGSVAHGIITDYTESDIMVELLERDGQVEIPWEQLHPVCRRRIQESLGFAEEQKTSYTIPGVKIYLKNGKIVYGKVVAEKKRWLMLQSKSNAGPLRISRKNLLRMENVDIAITRIYTNEQIYEKYRDKYKLKTGEGNLDFSRFLLNSGDCTQAKIHLQKALELNPRLEGKAGPLRKSIEKSERKQYRRNGLKNIEYYKRYHRYRDALRILDEMQESLEKKRYDELQNEIADERREYLQKKLPKCWFRKVSSKTARFCRRRSRMLQEAKDYAIKNMQEEIIDELADDFQISSRAVEEYFEKRSPGRVRKYSYGSGTFIVAPTPPRGGYIDEKMQIKFSGRAVKSPVTFEQWWKEAGSTRRSQWLSAYYWENTLRDCRVTSKICPQCDGKGKKVVHRKVVACKVCNGCGHERIVEVK